MYVDQEPNWAPLERALGQCRGEDHTSPICHYMYMGQFDSARYGVWIYLYKDSVTRRYVNVDVAGNAYRFVEDGDYERLPDYFAACSQFGNSTK